MSIEETHWLVDKVSGTPFEAGSLVVVPEVEGGESYSILEDEDVALEYAEEQGLSLEMPGSGGIPLLELENEPRGYWVISDSGYVGAAEDIVLVPAPEGRSIEDAEFTAEELKDAEVPEVSTEVRKLKGREFESVLD